MNFFGDVSNLLITAIFGLFILFIMLRFLFQFALVDFRNPICHAIARFTTPLLRPFRHIIPGYRRIDIASLVLLLLLQYVQIMLLLMVKGQIGGFASGVGLLSMILFSIFNLAMIITWVYIVSIFIMVIFSWIQTHGYNPVAAIADQLCRPLINPIRRRMPDTGMIDLSPWVVLILIYIVQMALKSLFLNLIGAARFIALYNIV